MKLIKFFIILLITASAVMAQTLKTGTTVAPLLKMGVGPRAVAMGGAFTATSNDITAAYWNPGGLSEIGGSEAFFNHANWFADINIDYAAFASTIADFGTVGAFVSVLSTEKMMVRTEDKPEGTGEMFKYGSMVIGLSYAKSLTDQFSIGFNAKYITEDIWHMNATGFALDIGTLYKMNILNEVRIAASISNFGTKMRLEGRDILDMKQVGTGAGNLIRSNIEMESFDLPLLFRFGLANDIIKSESSRLTLAVDAIHPNDHTEYINTGMEYSWNEMVSLRAGYNSLFEQNTEKGLTLGVGFNYRALDALNIRFDYAYEDMHRLTEVHYFGIGVKF